MEIWVHKLLQQILYCCLSTTSAAVQKTTYYFTTTSRVFSTCWSELLPFCITKPQTCLYSQNPPNNELLHYCTEQVRQHHNKGNTSSASSSCYLSTGTGSSNSFQVRKAGFLFSTNSYPEAHQNLGQSQRAARSPTRWQPVRKPGLPNQGAAVPCYQPEE